MIIATDKKGRPTVVSLAANPLASGGEAAVFELSSGLTDLVAKVFVQKFRTENKLDKINYLIQHNPNQAGDKDVVWPTHTLWENSSFIGFLMPKVQGEKLELLCQPEPKGKSLANFLQKYPQWQRFLRSEAQGISLRLKLCYNLLAAVEKLHKTNRYVLVDLKPDNILVQPNGLVTIIDTDSLQIADKEHFFPASVNSPEYTPAEYYQGANPQGQQLAPSWDCFSLAVLIYRLLLGIHPFAASCKGQYAHCQGTEDLIKNGLLPILPALQAHFHTIPPPHAEFAQLPAFLQNYLSASLQQASGRPALSQILPQLYQWLMNPASRFAPAINRQWWDKLDSVWQGIFERATKSNIQQSDFFQKIENLTELDCKSTQISSLEPLRELKNLTKLDCSFTQISSLEPLRELKNLTKLDCYCTQISSLEPLRELNLTELDCRSTQISSLEPLRELKNLTELWCCETQISSLEPLRELKNLTSLYCYSIKISSLEPLRELKNLTELDCRSTQISSLEPLRELKNLTELRCSNTQISSLEPLRELKNLTVLWCFNTQINDEEIQRFRKSHPDCSI